MILTIPYPNIDPVFLRIGPVQLRWYGLMYMLSFIIGFFVLRRYAKYRKLNLSTDDLYDLLFYLILGVMVGGRLGYVLFYDLGSYLHDPLSIFAIWQGGMSFHGGFIGMILAAMWITRKKGWNFWDIADLGSAVAPIGLGLGRIAPGHLAADRFVHVLALFAKVRRHQVGDVQKAVAPQAKVNERGLNARLDVGDPALVDVADVRCGAGSLHVQLFEPSVIQQGDPAFLALGDVD